MPLPEDLSTFEALTDIIARLRAPDGCPWDRKQTHRSLREHLLAESYEVLEALDRGDDNELCGELGDLLLQIVLHGQIAAEAGEFTTGDVIEKLNKKLIYRHPHIFGTGTAKDAEEVAHNWEVLKQQERAEGVSMLDGVPRQMPALSYSREVQKRVGRVGFDWADVDGVIEKLVEEIGELKRAENDAERASEFGDLLFTLVNIARRMDVDAEAALREANERFYRRFSYMEELCRRRGLKIEKLSFGEQNKLWKEAKKEVG
ncbi:MAG: nucleoside triphosphate pyrophosphohydrolase [Dehalococcoidales bacterium]|nr:nucleoside triphosphate pyrophosphohydrolase [Dehalococcoidales bacterium]